MERLLKKPKFLIFLLATVILLTVVFCYSQNQKPIETAQAQGINGVLRVHPTNPRYFTDDSGQAIYLTGSHTWESLNDDSPTDPPSEFDYNGYLEFLESYNHNFFRLWTWEQFQYYYGNDPSRMRYVRPKPWPRIGPGTALDGKPKFNLGAFDEEYFTRLHDRVQAAQNKGIYVSVMLFEGHGAEYSNIVWAWRGHPFHKDNNVGGIDGDTARTGRGHEFYTLDASSDVINIQKAYVIKVIDTVNEFDNVLYEIINEAHLDSGDWQKYMVDFIQDYERKNKPKQHPVGITSHWTLGLDNTWYLDSNADWVSPTGDHPANDSDPYRINPPLTDGSKVVLPDTDHIFGGTGGDLKWVWKSFLRGHNPIYMDAYEIYTDDWSSSVADNSTRDNMGYTLTYANKMDLVDMLPSDNPSLCSTTYCLRNPGQEYLIFQPDSDSFTVNLVAGEYDLEWFNPSIGSIVKTDTITVADGNKFFLPPFSGEAVLYLKAADCLAPDLICNQTIDLADLNSFKSLWGTSQADFNNDTKTNTQDLGIMMSTWGSY